MKGTIKIPIEWIDRDTGKVVTKKLTEQEKYNNYVVTLDHMLIKVYGAAKI